MPTILNAQLSYTFSTAVKVNEVGHDFTIQLKKWLDEKGIKNSFDTWHG